MSKHKSFRITDFSLSDAPWAIAAFLVISLFSIGVGLFVEAMPKFWSGLLLGVGAALLASLGLLRLGGSEADIRELPEPSESVRAKCDVSTSSFVEAVKAYREETGLGLDEATAVLRKYQAGEQV